MTAGRSRLLRLGVLLATFATAAGCSRQAAEGPHTPPAILDPVPGVKLPVVTLSQPGFAALRVTTEPVQVASGGLLIPTTAVIYSPDGRAWTYVMVGLRSFVRHAIVIDRITGTEAFLSSGPDAGTPVVTAGAPELLGTEYGVGEE